MSGDASRRTPSRNVIGRAVILSPGDRIEVCDLVETMEKQPGIRIGAGVTLELIKNKHIRCVVDSTKTLKEAADILGIDVATICRHRAWAV